MHAVRVRPLRWPWLVLAAALAAVTLAQLIPSQSVGPLLLVGGLDGVAWACLLRLAALVLGTVGLAGTAYGGLRGRNGFLADVLFGATTIALVCWCTVGMLVAVFLAFTASGREYRTVGSVEGVPVVVQLDVGWRGADYLDAGLQRGVWLDLRARDSGGAGRFAPALSRWRFAVSSSATRVLIRYDTGAGGSGVLTIPRRR